MKGISNNMPAVNSYSETEIQFLKDNYLNMTMKQMAEALNRKTSSVSYMVNKLGLIKQPHNKWTDEEIQFLKDNYIEMSSEEIAKYVNHTVDAINTMRDHLKLVRNATWTKEETKYLQENFDKYLFSDLSKIMNRTEGALRAKCFDLGLCKKSAWTEQEMTFLKENYQIMPTIDIAKKLCRSVDAVQLKAEHLGIKKSIYICDYDYFHTINTEDKAYWLGFLSADGWIYTNKKTGSCDIGVELQYSDIKHLEKLNKCLNSNYLITDRWRPCLISSTDPTKPHHTCTLRIFSTIMYEDLIDKGFTNNKSFDYSMPKIDNDFVRDYVRGYFDGNGCFTSTNHSCSVRICTASKQLSHDFTDILNTMGFNPTVYINITEYGTPVYYISLTRHNEQLDFLDWIYKDSHMYLDRKYNKYIKVINNKTRI